jgi:hypothetical protein
VEAVRTQPLALERRTARGGRDSIDHGPGASAHDDVVNAAALALWIASQAASSAYSLDILNSDDGKPTDPGVLQILRLNHARQLGRRW